MTTTSQPAGPEAPAADSDNAGPDHDHSSPPGPGRAATGRHRLRPISVLVLLGVTAFLYLWDLSESGYANSFYAAAAQAGSQSWKAFFFGSLDAGNSITVDKPPASVWLMGLSVRIFGLSSWSILVPEALLGVATVGTVYATIKRISGHPAGLAAGALTALTPAAALMFRFDNPDALLLFLLVFAGYCVLRATERATGRWLMLAGALVGLGFLTKMLQAFLVLPAFALVYLIAAPTTVRTRLLHLLGAFGAMIISLGWWVAIVELWPKSSRPYIDGSTDNSILQLVFGYNGFGRLTGDETGQVRGPVTGGASRAAEGILHYFRGGRGGGGGFSGEAGILRLFQGVSGGMISWLLPATLVVLVAGLVLIGKAPRTDRSRAALIMFSGSMITTALVFSFMAGIYHDYYTVALAPWIAGTMIIGGVVCWRQRHRLPARLALAAAAAVSTAWAFVLLGQSGAEPYTGLRWPVLATGLLATAGFVLLHRLPKVAAAAVLSLAGITALTGPAAYTVDTVRTPHTGSIVTAGPVSSFGGGGGFGRNGPTIRGHRIGQGWTGQGWTGQNRVGRNWTGRSRTGFSGVAPGNGFQHGQTRIGSQGVGRASAGMGGLLDGTTVSAEMKRLLSSDADSYTWVAATTRSQNAASYQLATEHPVMAIGGFNGTTNSPTLEQFESYVAGGRVHYFIAGGDYRMAGGGTKDPAAQIQSWVEQHFTARTVDGLTLYDLTQGR